MARAFARLLPRNAEPPHGWVGSGDALARLIGRGAGRWKHMDAPAASRGIVAATLEQQQRFEGIIRSFRHGYDASLAAATPLDLAVRLAGVALPLRGFAFEGAGMGLALRQALNPSHPPLLRGFLAERGDAYTYLLHVGAGWNFGLVPGAAKLLTELHPVFRWLAFDGMGFAHCFFHGLAVPRVVDPPRWVARDTYAPRAFDQGVGRCLWFAAGGQVANVAPCLARFAAGRHRDLWAGLGLAVVYAGEPAEGDLRALRALAGLHHEHLAQGVAFAAKALQRGGQLTEWHNAACRVLCGVSAVHAARIADAALAALSFDGPEPAYEEWRRRIRGAFAGTTLPAPFP